MFFGVDNLREPGTKQSDCCYDNVSRGTLGTIVFKGCDLFCALVAIDRETRITVKTKKMKLKYNCPTAGT